VCALDGAQRGSGAARDVVVRGQGLRGRGRDRGRRVQLGVAAVTWWRGCGRRRLLVTVARTRTKLGAAVLGVAGHQGGSAALWRPRGRPWSKLDVARAALRLAPVATRWGGGVATAPAASWQKPDKDVLQGSAWARRGRGRRRGGAPCSRWSKTGLGGELAVLSVMRPRRGPGRGRGLLLPAVVVMLASVAWQSFGARTTRRSSASVPRRQRARCGCWGAVPALLATAAVLLGSRGRGRGRWRHDKDLARRALAMGS